MSLYYTYVLECADHDWYIGFTEDLKHRPVEHNHGKCETTKRRLPVELIYFEACRSLKAARAREQQLQSGFGRGYLIRRLAFEKGSSIRHNA